MNGLLKGLSTGEIAFLFLAGFVALAIAGIFLARPFSRRWIHRRGRSNDVIDPFLQSFAALYGILLALLAVEAYQDFSAVQDAVSKKALTFATLSHNVHGLPMPLRAELLGDLHAYAVEALATHWPKEGNEQVAPPSTGASPTLVRMMNRLLGFEPTTKTQELVYGEVFRQINVMIEQRRLLLESGAAGIPNALWAIVFLGAFLFLMLICLFDMDLHVHLLLAIPTSLFLGGVIFLIAALDNPFTGGITVDPGPIIFMRDATARLAQ